MLANQVANILNSQVSQTPDRTSGNELDKDAFLLLLVKQLGNQDPLDPIKNEDFMSQLAQFSSLEQSMNLNASFEQFLSFQQLTQASTLIGKMVISINQVEGGIIPVAGTVNQVMMVNGTVYLALSDGSEVELSTIVSVEPGKGTGGGS